MNGLPDIDERLRALRTGGGRHFFDPDMQDVFPQADFRMCVELNCFDYVIRIGRDGDGLLSQMIPVRTA